MHAIFNLNEGFMCRNFRRGGGGGSPQGVGAGAEAFEIVD